MAFVNPYDPSTWPQNQRPIVNPYDPRTWPAGTGGGSAQAAATGGIPSVQELQDRAGRFAGRVKNAGNNFVNAADSLQPNARATQWGLKTGQASRDFAKLGFNPLLAGIGGGALAALGGGGLAETLGAGAGGAGAAALAGKFATGLMAKAGPLGGLAAAGLSIAAPMLGSALGGGIGRAIDKGPGEKIGAAMSRGSETNINNTFNPSGSLGPTLTEAEQRMLRSGQLNAELLKKYGYDSQDVAAYGVQKVAIPLLNHQALLRAKMLPLDTAARLAQQTNQNIGQMYNTSIAGTSGIAQQIAANNPYAGVMI